MSRASKIVDGLRALEERGVILAHVRFPGDPDHYLISFYGNEKGVYLTAAEAEAFILGASLTVPTKA